jgi:CRP/FNR family transcriptional regulator, cyclic AMP receptor protein
LLQNPNLLILYKLGFIFLLKPQNNLLELSLGVKNEARIFALLMLFSFYQNSSNMNIAAPEISSLLAKFPLFEVLSEDDKLFLRKIAHYKESERGVELYKPGQIAEMVYFLVAGSVKISSIADDGREIVKQVLYSPHMFGEQCLTSDCKRREYASVMTDKTAYFCISADDFHILMEKNYKLTRQLLQIVGTRARVAEERFEALLFKDARTRIIDFIRESAVNVGRRVGVETLLKHTLTQQDIANLTGTSRQTVTAVLNELRKSDKIYFNRKSILIRDMTALA